MSPLKIAIIGAGSSYTPEIIEEIHKRRERFPVTQITFMDIDPGRLETMLGFCRRFAAHLGSEIPIEATTDRREALQDANFVLTQIRVGGNAQRILDEKIPLKYGVIGQETTGPGGMFKALRTIPPILEVARDVEEICPRAWIINYANPTGMVAEAVTQNTGVTIAGLCAGGNFPRDHAVQALGVDPEEVSYDYFGLNHLNFGYNLRGALDRPGVRQGPGGRYLGLGGARITPPAPVGAQPVPALLFPPGTLPPGSPSEAADARGTGPADRTRGFWGLC
jgi:6-phospho-beta-glucosidase